jgi:hypothetical protein
MTDQLAVRFHAGHQPFVTHLKLGKRTLGP